MSECCVKFQTPASRDTVNYLIIEYLKYILYYRGQFPLPIDQLKQAIKAPIKLETVKIGNHTVYNDEDNLSSAIPKSKKMTDRTKQVFLDSINKFDEFFTQLLGILQKGEVLEIVMNLGTNMMSPKELHHITLPSFHIGCEYLPDLAISQRCRLDFFKTLMHSNVLQNVYLDNPLPISVLLRMKSGATLSEYMEQKRFYVPPQKCKQVKVRFDETCSADVMPELKNFKDMTLEENISAASQNSDLWVKLKSELKGFKNFIESQTTLSKSSFF